jgi:(4-alkanoyl-5-oxo-2,5-dihydrofuran-3-yl)methyl phosphate reductase
MIFKFQGARVNLLLACRHNETSQSKEKKMILVTGATGNIGKELVPQILASDKPLRVLVRDPQRAAHLDPRAERFVGDLNKPESLVPALENVERVFLLTFETQQDKNIIAAAKFMGVQQIVKLSTLEANQPHLKVGRWHREREELIESSGLEWTFLRPGMFMSNTIEWWSETIKKQAAVYFPGGKGRAAPVDPRDVAAVAACTLTEPAHTEKIYELTGPELLSIGDMAQVMGRVLGKRIKYINVPLIAAKVQMRLSGIDRELVGALLELAIELRKDRAAQRTETVEGITGRPSRSFEAWCREHIQAFQ